MSIWEHIHYVKVPLNHIILDFDISNDYGEKPFKLNLKSANEWKPTCTELSKSEKGIHLLKKYYDICE